MKTATGPTHSGVGIDAAEQDKIREQLDRMLEASHFKQSRRYPALLRYIVEETLQGRGALLKERVLGVEVFDRDPGYDTSTDPIVRVTTAEIRKRIAQYYHDEAHDAELRIGLPSGRYVAEFRPGKTAPASSISAIAQTELTEPAHPSTTLATHAEDPLQAAGKKGWLWSALTVAALVSVAVTAYHWSNPPALEQLWSPLLTSGKQIFFCLPTEVGRHGGALTSPSDLFNSGKSEPERPSSSPQVISFLEHETTGENIVFSDAMAALRIGNMMAVRGREVRVKLNVATTLDDLRQGPAVLIGGLDNQWTMQSLAPLRFRFAGSNEEVYWISDTLNPSDRSWSLDLKQQYTKVTRDYAIVARVHNGETGYPQMIVAGIGMSGTLAAGEFLVDPTQTNDLRRRVGPGFQDRDFEAVLSTNVVNGIAGMPRIVGVWVKP